MKKIMQLMMVLFATLLTVSAVSAGGNDITTSSDVTLHSIEVNGRTYDAGRTLRVELGDSLNIEVELEANANVKGVQVTAELFGYEYRDREATYDSSRIFDLKQGDTTYVGLDLQIPLRAEKDFYSLVITVADRGVTYSRQTFDVRVSGARNSLLIRDVVFSPNGVVVAGRSLLTQVRLENIGDRSQDDVKVTVSIPALGTSESIFMDEIRAEDFLG